MRFTIGKLKRGNTNCEVRINAGLFFRQYEMASKKEPEFQYWWTVHFDLASICDLCLWTWISLVFRLNWGYSHPEAWPGGEADWKEFSQCTTFSLEDQFSFRKISWGKKPNNCVPPAQSSKGGKGRETETHVNHLWEKDGTTDELGKTRVKLKRQPCLNMSPES